MEEGKSETKCETTSLETILSLNQEKITSEKQSPIKLSASYWVEVRLFISSTFIDTEAERNVLIKKVIPDVNRKLFQRHIRIVPVDLRWGVINANTEYAIQKLCLNEIDNCRLSKNTYAYFIGLRTERYGWVQKNLADENQYENPELFSWIRLLREHNKHLSITSLECVHATSKMETSLPENCIFIYEREIENTEAIEPEFKWIFDREHRPIGGDMGVQYTFTEDSSVYLDDQKKLNDYLRSLSHVSYSEYKCVYEKGGARKTGEKNGKDFGIGYVKGLEDFERKVKADLLKSIEANFEKFDFSNYSDLQIQNMEFEKTNKEKASTFIGRHEYVKQIKDHCERKDNKNVMVVSGEPGMGKSSLMAYAAHECIKKRDSKKTFVFVHGVDTCPESNRLDKMLLRLHENICDFLNIENTLTSDEELKSGHVSCIENLARSNSHVMFQIFVDAVNQLHEGMQARSMWWLPSDDCPQNVRFVISTLFKENKTYANTIYRIPDAVIVKVEPMSEKECMELVSGTLKKYNKKLTTDDSNTFLKNQMSLLVGKNQTPLYLQAACEAIRTQGVYEEMTPFIRELPPTVRDLFKFLLDKWSEDYEHDFIRYLVSIITVSGDGLLENTISDIFSYMEEEYGKTFDCSISRVFSVIRGFLSSGGGGLIRFFHNQINKVVEVKYLSVSSSFQAEVNEILAGFYIKNIKCQLTESPTTPKPDYFADYIRKVAQHQINARKNDEDTVDFSHTLRNIFYIRHRILAEQYKGLQSDYMLAQKQQAFDKSTIKAIFE